MQLTLRQPDSGTLPTPAQAEGPKHKAVHCASPCAVSTHPQKHMHTCTLRAPANQSTEPGATATPGTALPPPPPQTVRPPEGQHLAQHFARVRTPSTNQPGSQHCQALARHPWPQPSRIDGRLASRRGRGRRRPQASLSLHASQRQQGLAQTAITVPSSQCRHSSSPAIEHA